MAQDTQPSGVAEQQIAYSNFQRYEYGRWRGHRDYCRQAIVCENFYLGGGLQWDPDDLQRLTSEGRPAIEFNRILGDINSAIGYQIHNRMDIGFRPRGGVADEQMSKVISKLAMYIADREKLHWKETQVFSDGMIQQRGYYDIRMRFDKNLQGDIDIAFLDPLDVIPDPDAKAYDPADWADVTVSRWLTADDIENDYGSEARLGAEATGADDQDFGDDTDEEGRNHFGDSNTGNAGDYVSIDNTGTSRIKRYRVVERQLWKTDTTQVVITASGDILRQDNMTPEALSHALSHGGIQVKRRFRRPRWIVSTCDRLLHDAWSPYDDFTIVPYFPFFRRGKTRGLVDNAIGPQQLLNKSLSQYLHIINTSANSGWKVKENSLKNMTTEELEDRGAETGLVLELDDINSAEKIQPNQIPTGVEKMISLATTGLGEATGIEDTLAGRQGREISGVAIQSRQFAAQQKLAVPLDNLAYTRNLLATRMLKLIQQFYTEPRILRITETDATGKEVTEELAINQPSLGSTILNDVTVGEYDVVITETPMAVTFQNSQFLQIMEMMDKGAPIPWTFAIKTSSLADKTEIITAMDEQQQNAASDPLTDAQVKEIEAKTRLAEANAEKVRAEGVNKAVEAQYSAMQAGGILMVTPAVAGISDALLRSAGYQDKDAAPIVPQPGLAYPLANAYQGGPIGVADPLMANTNPMTPANPGVGLQRGIETPALEGV